MNAIQTIAINIASDLLSAWIKSCLAPVLPQLHQQLMHGVEPLLRAIPPRPLVRSVIAACPGHAPAFWPGAAPSPARSFACVRPLGAPARAGAARDGLL